MDLAGFADGDCRQRVSYRVIVQPVAMLEDDRDFKPDQEVRVRRGGGYILTSKPHTLRLRGSRVASTETFHGLRS